MASLSERTKLRSTTTSKMQSKILTYDFAGIVFRIQIRILGPVVIVTIAISAGLSLQISNRKDFIILAAQDSDIKQKQGGSSPFVCEEKKKLWVEAEEPYRNVKGDGKNRSVRVSTTSCVIGVFQESQHHRVGGGWKRGRRSQPTQEQ